MFDQAFALHKRGQLAEAAAIYRKVLLQNPKNANALHLLGVVEYQRKDPQTAIELIDRAIEMQPNNAAFYSSRGNALQDLKRLDQALESYDRALAIKPDFFEALINRGATLHDLKRFEGALASYDLALAVKRDHAEALYNRGLALKGLGRLDEALASYDRALAVNPNHVKALCNRGNALRDLQRVDESLVNYDRALEIRPDYTQAQHGRAIARLLVGDFAGGWRDYLVRDLIRSPGMDLYRLPLADDLRGCRVFVLPDQGLGDEVFFLRFAGALKKRGATIFYRASTRIAAMIARSRAVDSVVGPEEIPSQFTLQVSVGDLPYLLGMSSVTEIPPPLRLPPLPEALDRMAVRLRALGPAPYIGITWRAGTKDLKNALYKEVPRAALAKTLADVPGTLLALQRLPMDGEVKAFANEAGRPVHDLTALNESLEDMLAALALIDDYVCVSNTNVHLRAGTGRSCRVLMPRPPDFRWMAEGAESPWFPGTPIYRQKPDGDWDLALAALKKDFV